MKISDARSLVELIRGTSVGDIGVVSLIVLPILLSAWIVLFKLTNVLPIDPCGRARMLAIMGAIYCGAIGAMKVFESKAQKMTRALHHIRNRLRNRSGRSEGLASFEYIQNNVDASYTEKFLLELIEQFPHELMRITCTGKRPGLKLVIDEEA